MKKQEYFRMHKIQKSHWWYETRRNYIQTILRTISLGENNRILDVGCGTGANTPILRQFGTVIGLDRSPHARSLYRKQPNVVFTFGSAEKIPYSNNTFDIVLVADVLYHKRIKSPVRVLREIRRVLKPNGYCVITDCAHPFLFGVHDEYNEARERFTKKKIEKLVRTSGLVCIRNSYTFMLVFPIFIMVRLFEKILKPRTIVFEEHAGIFANSIGRILGKIECAMLRKRNLPFGSSMIFLTQKHKRGMRNYN